MSLDNVRQVVCEHYSEKLWQAIKANIAVISALSLQQRDHCLVLVYEGPSGQGKSTVIRAVMPTEVTQNYLLRVDDFTAASFVSHAANRTAAQLRQIDLLPRLKDKVMLTKELAPLFRDEDRVLRQNFARLTSILDGNGYMASSGSHGMRGYDGRFVFNWIGATTPIPERTHRIMAQLGNRILFYEITGEDFPEQDLVQFARSYSGTNNVELCRQAVNEFLQEHFGRYPVDSIEPQTVVITPDLLRDIVRYATLICHGRIEIEQPQSGELNIGEPEGAHRVILLLRTLAQGFALAHDRRTVTAEDLLTIRHIAFSCIPPNRRALLRGLIDFGGRLRSGEVETGLAVGSRPTALKRMRELAATRIAVFTEGNQGTATPATITIADDWRWLLEDTANSMAA